MLLRLEVDGFKNLLGFKTEFGPLTCIAGQNGVGKSNVFDAIELLSLIADRPLQEAAQLVRSDRSDRGGEPNHLFANGAMERSMSFAAEVIVPGLVTDDFGVEAKPTITLLRYELEIGFRPPERGAHQGHLVVDREELRHINVGDAHRHIHFPHSVRDFRSAVVFGRRSGGPFISTEVEKGRITVHQDGGSRGRPRRALPTGASTTVVSTVNTADDPTILALRREFQSWRRLALEPSALRTPDRFTDPRTMTSGGRHLAAALFRIASSAQDPSSPEDVYARIANRLSGLAGLDIRSLHVDVDDVRELLDVVVEEGHRGRLPARSLSEGTLRFLALCTILEDPEATGLITMEEPENGIHPANLNQMVELIEDLAVDPGQAPAPDNPLRQIIINTHSPAVVQLVSREDLLVAVQRFVESDDSTVLALRLDGLSGTSRTGGSADGASELDLIAYLEKPPGARIALNLDVA
ncbi:MAG: AAA family ATPase [Acidimicrobiales bacterium]